MIDRLVEKKFESGSLRQSPIAIGALNGYIQQLNVSIVGLSSTSLARPWASYTVGPSCSM